jgi:uncharacterized protein
MLLAECHPLFPVPKASIHAITVISKILKIQIDVKDIKENLEFLRIQHRKLMQQTIDALQQDQRAEPSKKMPQIYK